MKLDQELIKTIDSIMLSRRETECVEHLLRGKPHKAIGKALGLSPRTVETYLDNVKSKLGIQSKAELINKAIDSWYQRRT